MILEIKIKHLVICIVSSISIQNVFCQYRIFEDTVVKVKNAKYELIHISKETYHGKKEGDIIHSSAFGTWKDYSDRGRLILINSKSNDTCFNIGCPPYEYCYLTQKGEVITLSQNRSVNPFHNLVLYSKRGKIIFQRDISSDAGLFIDSQTFEKLDSHNIKSLNKLDSTGYVKYCPNGFYIDIFRLKAREILEIESLTKLSRKGAVVKNIISPNVQRIHTRLLFYDKSNPGIKVEREKGKKVKLKSLGCVIPKVSIILFIQMIMSMNTRAI